MKLQPGVPQRTAERPGHSTPLPAVASGINWSEISDRSIAHALPIAILSVVWVLFVLAVYCPDLGRGFVKDDFTWIRSGKAVIAQPARLISPVEPGFYRPVVTATFAWDYAQHGWQPRGYGWTNLLLYVGCVAAIIALALTLKLRPWPAGVGAFLWAVNPHGVGMSLMWLSGRTALCLTFFSVLAGVAFLRRRYSLASVLILCALGSKEEAILLPFILLTWAWLDERPRDKPTFWIAPTAAALLPLVAYFVLRSRTPAFTMSSAPSFYQLSADLRLVLRSLVEYADRSATIVALGVFVGCVVFRRRPVFVAARRPALMAIWWLGMFAITIWLPVRSSLYAVCPSVGAALLGAMLLDGVQTSEKQSGVVLAVVFATILILALPSYQLRNDRWVEGARVSQRTLQAIASDLAQLPERGVIVFDDQDQKPSNLQNAFGDLLTEALRTVFERDWVVRMAPTTDDDSIAVYRLLQGHVARIR
jgi:hypothetical protein